MTESIWVMFQIALFAVAFVTFVVVMIWQNAKVDGLFRFVGLNQIVSFDGGKDAPLRAVANLPKGWRVVRLRVIRDPSFRPVQSLMRKFGIFWKGFPAHTHIWTFVHERLNPKRDDNTPVTEWVKRDEEAKSSDYLLFEKPHWVAVPGAEFKNGFRAHLLVSYWSRTIDLEKTYNLRGEFFPPMNSAVLAHTKTECSKYDYDVFTKIDTDGTITSRDEVVNEGDDFCLNIAEGAARVAVREAGQEIYDVSILFYDAADKDTERLRSAEAKALIELEVKRLEAKGQIADIDELSKKMKEHFPGADQTELAKIVERLGVAGRIRDSKVISVGGGAGIMLDTTAGDDAALNKGGRKKRNR